MTSRPSAAGLLPFLAARSAYSLLSGSPQPARLAEAAAAAGYRSLALLDEGNLYALPEFITQAERCGLKALAGTRLPLADGSWLYLWARSRAGYGRLCALLSRWLAARPECAGSEAGLVGLPAGTGGRGGAAARLPVSSSAGAADFDPVAGLLAGGWQGLYVACTGRGALQRFAEAAAGEGCSIGSAVGGGGDTATGASGREDNLVAGTRGTAADAAGLEGGGEEQAAWFAALVQGTPIRDLALFARGLGLPLLAVVDCPWLDAEDVARGRLLQAVRERRTVAELFGSDGIWAAAGGGAGVVLAGGAGGAAGSQRLLLPSPEQAARSYSAWPDALANACALAESCAAAETFLSPVPVFPAYQDQSAAESLAVLRRACVEQLPRRYPDVRQRQAAAQRLERELAIIAPKGFSAYFLLVRDIVGLCPRTCGRGSAASSVVSYLLGITHVDPVAHDLFFERFLNEGRTDPPDIDIDFPWDEREQVLRQVFEQWPGASAMVADHCCFRGRGRIRETALAFGKSEAECGQLTRAWLHGGAEAVPPELAQAAALLKDMPRYIGTHPGGVVITPRPTAWYSHVQANSFGYPVLAWEKDGVEQAGLVKIDLLGNRSLSVLRDCIELVNTQR
ncbi:MAG: PHP domain-containing protein, partial [Spirochaetes bacterium]|nr:PHP domain-containing protein [Spirochaetota bacterium]